MYEEDVKQWYGTLLSDDELLKIDSTIDSNEDEWYQLGEDYVV